MIEGLFAPMVFPLFGKKPSIGQRPRDQSRSEPNDGSAVNAETDSSLDFFSQLGDAGRTLADAADKIHVEQGSVDTAAVIEEAAILYANANDAAARAVLDEAANLDAGTGSETVWHMLLDLCRLSGDREGFHASGVAFAQRFEKSPPVFDEGEMLALPRTQGKESSATVNLSGSLNEASRPQLEQLARIGAKSGRLRLDLSRLRNVTEGGCALLNDSLAALKRDRAKVLILGARHALGLLEPYLKVGEARARDVWLLALNLMLYLDDEGKFEDMAVNFAITFEESPPSWEPVCSATPTDPTASQVSAPSGSAAPDELVLEGELGGTQPDAFNQLAAFAADREEIRIDMRRVQRMQFVTAGALFNQLAQLQKQGKRITLHRPNEMVAALLRIMGVDQVAQIECKKF